MCVIPWTASWIVCGSVARISLSARRYRNGFISGSFSGVAPAGRVNKSSQAAVSDGEPSGGGAQKGAHAVRADTPSGEVDTSLNTTSGSLIANDPTSLWGHRWYVCALRVLLGVAARSRRVKRDGGRYWTRTSDLVGVNDAL
jgi:hypothetical protein